MKKILMLVMMVVIFNVGFSINSEDLTIKKDNNGKVVSIMETVHWRKGEAYYTVNKENTGVGNFYEHAQNINFNGTIVEGWFDYRRQKRAFKFEVNGVYGYVYVEKQWAFDSQRIVFRAIEVAKDFNKY